MAAPGGCRLVRIVGRHCERVLRIEMKLLDGESESRRSGAGRYRRRAGVLRGPSTREDRHGASPPHGVEFRHRVVTHFTGRSRNIGVPKNEFLSESAELDQKVGGSLVEDSCLSKASASEEKMREVYS